MKELHTLKTNIPEEILLAAAAMWYGWSTAGEFKYEVGVLYRRERGYGQPWKAVSPQTAADWRNTYRNQAARNRETIETRFVTT